MTTPLEALAYLSRQEPTPGYFLAFHKEVNEEKNVRGAVMLLASHVETCLRYALTHNAMLPRDNYKLLFHSGAPLNSFEAKIRLGFAIGIYKKQTKDNLDCIKVIRNAFAHAVNPISFDTPEVKAVCDLMTMPEIAFPRHIRAVTAEIPLDLPAKATPRQKFQAVCEAISHNLFVFGTSICRGIPSDPQIGNYVKRVKPKPLP